LLRDVVDVGKPGNSVLRISDLRMRLEPELEEGRTSLRIADVNQMLAHPISPLPEIPEVGPASRTVSAPEEQKVAARMAHRSGRAGVRNRQEAAVGEHRERTSASDARKAAPIRPGWTGQQSFARMFPFGNSGGPASIWAVLNGLSDTRDDPDEPK
jgi:hypothetical protein